MRNRKLIFILLMLLTGGPAFLLYNIYSFPNPESVRPEIQNYLNSSFTHQFVIRGIKLHQSPDLFHQPDAYTLSLVSKDGITLNNIHLEFNKYQNKWIPCYGTDIEKSYLQALKKSGPAGK